MRAEPNVQDQGPSTPACVHCGLPLMGGADFCPFCERPVVPARDGLLGRATGTSGARLTERGALIVIAAACAALAVLGVVAALATSA